MMIRSICHRISGHGNRGRPNWPRLAFCASSRRLLSTKARPLPVLGLRRGDDGAILVLAGVGTGKVQDAYRGRRAPYCRGQHCDWQAPAAALIEQGDERNLIERLRGPVAIIDHRAPHPGNCVAD